uniref:Integrin subunit alpha 7 n=1 Tax=Sphenodon punctatus TaxID=8508 RepID=A0A8D0HJ26_SPHPU
PFCPCRSRPVIHISRNVTISPQQIDLESHNCHQYEGNCVNVRACFSYTANPPSYNPRVTLEFTFEADGDRRKLGQPLRVSFLHRPPA